jgi:glycosyltransferase involved in cell wall biosynthesis
MLVEAMATGVAVIGSDSGEIPHVLGDGGMVTPEGDAEALRQALDRLLADPDSRAELAARGRARAQAEYALPVVARRQLDFFRTVWEAKARPGVAA